MYPPISSSDSSPAVRAEQLLRNVCGWHVAPVVDEVLTLDGNGTSRIALPSKRVEDVTSVTVDGLVLLSGRDYRWSADGWITRVGGVWPDVERSIVVSLRHGFDFAPELEQVLEALVARMALSPSGIEKSESVGPFRTEYAVSSDGVRTVGLFQSELASLAPYRLEGVSRV